jgi:hypothetical protein
MAICSKDSGNSPHSTPDVCQNVPGLNGETAARDVEIIAALLAGARASERGESPIRAGSHRVGGHPLTLDSSYMAYLEKHG